MCTPCNINNYVVMVNKLACMKTLLYLLVLLAFVRGKYMRNDIQKNNNYIRNYQCNYTGDNKSIFAYEITYVIIILHR